MGRPPKPLEEHIADGTFRPDRHGDGVLALSEPVTFLPAPAHLPDDARDVWSSVVSLIAESGILQGADELALEAVSLNVATWRRAQEDIERNGILVTGRFDTDVANPAITVRDKAMSEFRQWAGKFGLTPSDRASLGMQLVKGKSASESWDDALGPDPRSEVS